MLALETSLCFKIVLYQPEIPSNTGNIGRLCVGTNSELHIIKPMKFFLNDKYLKRAGLDYWEKVKLFIHNDWISFLQLNSSSNIYFCETSGQKNYTEFKYQRGDCFVFGSESKGLPAVMLQNNPQNTLKINMNTDIRSLNICNTVAIVLYEAIRQTGWL